MSCAWSSAPNPPLRLFAVAETTQVRGDQSKAIGQARRHRLPDQPEFWPTMQQHRTSHAGLGDMHRRAIRLLE